MTVLDRTRLTDRLHFKLMNNSEIVKRLKIGLSLVIGYLLGKLAASWNMAYYSEIFSAGFLIGAIGTQGALRCYDLWRQKKG